MDNLETLINEIQSLLSKELPEEYRSSLEEFNKLISQDLYRAAYAELDELKRKNNWNPSVQLLGVIERFQVVF